MGKILQIRVGAWTYNEDEVVAAWPNLSALVWSELDRWGPEGMRRGVTELAEYLPDSLRFADIPDDVKKRLAPGAEKVSAILKDMRAALADWEPRRANALSDALEDALTALEAQTPPLRD
ncbi:formin-like protein 18 [Mailhella sp.]|uniref:formin-like protein 18 n=1 Tax=Mailhella sp. TaxID=1981029 RepID=UPI003AB2BA70